MFLKQMGFIAIYAYTKHPILWLSIELLENCNMRASYRFRNI